MREHTRPTNEKKIIHSFAMRCRRVLFAHLIFAKNKPSQIRFHLKINCVCCVVGTTSRRNEHAYRMNNKMKNKNKKQKKNGSVGGSIR